MYLMKVFTLSGDLSGHYAGGNDVGGNDVDGDEIGDICWWFMWQCFVSWVS